MSDGTLAAVDMLADAIPILTQWFVRHQKDLPWRLDPSPYHVWISETMLQQTRIETVIPYYLRFIRELPSVRALAEVDDDRLMKLWQGLGYYSRARNLKKAAGLVVDLYAGELPREPEKLRRLPGIGDYTAGAIASLAFGEPEPAVDGNVLRVVMRLIACGEDVTRQRTKKEVADRLRAIYPSGAEASALTQGLMELGETVCLPNGQPKCADCPLNGRCRAYAENEVCRYPVRAPKKGRRVEERTVFLPVCGDRYALRRREDGGLLANLWEFPNVEGLLSAEDALQACRKMGLCAASVAPCGGAKHIFTHVEWHMTGYTAECRSETGAFVWKSADEIAGNYAVPSAFRYFVRLIGADGVFPSSKKNKNNTDGG